MDKISVADARKAEAVGRQVRLQGWVRTRRDSKGGFSFIELNDGSCQGNVQVVAPGELANYEAVVKHLHTGASVTIEGEVKASPAKGQATEVLASRVELIGDADVDTYPLQKKGHSFEFLRGIAHLRPRTNTFGAVVEGHDFLGRVDRHLSSALGGAIGQSKPWHTQPWARNRGSQSVQFWTKRNPCRGTREKPRARGRSCRRRMRRCRQNQTPRAPNKAASPLGMNSNDP